MLAAINPATHYTAMQPPSAKLCRHLVQRYAATDWAVEISSTPEACAETRSFLKIPYLGELGSPTALYIQFRLPPLTVVREFLQLAFRRRISLKSFLHEHSTS